METQIERTFLQDSNVQVTNSRFVAGGKTFAMRNISSVSVHHIPKSKIGPMLLMLLSVAVLLTGDTGGIASGLILLGLAILWYRSIKDIYSVRINSNSGETDGLTSKDRSYIHTVVDAVNEAIIHRG
jgi:hypothetical protein